MHIIERDIIISGGGATGLSLALALAGATNLRIAVIESHQLQTADSHPGFDSRSVALAQNSIQLLNKFGLGSINPRSCPIRTIQVTDRGHLGQTVLNAADYQFDVLGRVAELHELGQCLHQHLAAYDDKQLTLFCPDSVAKIEEHASHVEVTTTAGKKLSAKLLVVAEGAESPTRSMLNIQVTRKPYQQAAIIANVSTSKPHAYKAFERFTDSGPLAMLPLNPEPGKEQQNRCSLVWTVNESDHQAIMKLNDVEFLARLQAQLGFRLGTLTQVGARVCYPLQLIRANQITAHRAVLVGNSSQSLHPIAGQGLNLALRDIDCLYELIKRYHSESRDLGSYSLLESYSSNRQIDRNKVIGLTDGLVRLFSNEYGPLVVGRNLGLAALNLFEPLKASFADRAMGLK